jgi:hypothetical protein
VTTPLLEPANWIFDASSSKPWRYFRGDSWADGLAERALDRLLENSSSEPGCPVKLTHSNSRNAWKRRVVVVDRAEPVYWSSDRIAQMPDGTKIANTFKRPLLTPERGDWTPIWRVLLNLVGGTEEDMDRYLWLESWTAKVVQRVYAGAPEKIGTGPVFFGAKGSGKGIFEVVMRALLGHDNVRGITQTDLESDFNSFLDGALLVFADEIITTDKRAASLIARLKNAITNRTHHINKKGIPQYTRDAVENWVFASNSHRPVEIESGDRRFTMFRTGGPIPVELGGLVADDARAGGPIVRAFLAHLLSLPAESLVADYRVFDTEEKHDVARASGTSANKFASEVRSRGFWSATGAYAVMRGQCSPGDLYVPGPDGWATVGGVGPVMLNRTLMDVYRAYSNEIGAPVQQEAVLLAALKEIMPETFETTLLVSGRREKVLAGLPGMMPEEIEPAIAVAAVEVSQSSPLPKQSSLF